MADRPGHPVNNRAPFSIPVRRHPLPAVPGHYGRPGCQSLVVNPTCAGEQATKSAWPYPAPVISSRSPRRTYRRFARFGGHFFVAFGQWRGNRVRRRSLLVKRICSTGQAAKENWFYRWPEVSLQSIGTVMDARVQNAKPLADRSKLALPARRPA